MPIMHKFDFTNIKNVLKLCTHITNINTRTLIERFHISVYRCFFNDFFFFNADTKRRCLITSLSFRWRSASLLSLSRRFLSSASLCVSSIWMGRHDTFTSENHGQQDNFRLPSMRCHNNSKQVFGKHLEKWDREAWGNIDVTFVKTETVDNIFHWPPL